MLDPVSTAVIERPRLLTDKRLRVWGAAFVAASWIPVLGAPLRGFFDFSAFYAAGGLVGHWDLVRLTTVIEREAELGIPPTTFVNPPAYALPYAPLAGLPFAIAGYLAMAVMFGLLIAAVEIGRRRFGIGRKTAFFGTLAWPPAAAGVLTGQSSSLALLLVVLVALGLERRDGRGDLLAGAAVAALAFKPQLALPLLGLLVLRGSWRPLVTALSGLVMMYLLSVAATGGNWSWLADWLNELQTWQQLDVPQNGWQSISLPGLCARLSIPVAVGYGVGAVLIVWSLPALRSRPVPAAVALACVLGLVISPHALIYEATLMLPALALIVDRPRWPRWMPVALYLLAAAWPVGTVLGWQPMALALPVFAWYLVARQPKAETQADGAQAPEGSAA